MNDASTDSGRGKPQTWAASLRDTYLAMDRRTLGFTRILLGFLLLGDLFRRTSSWLDMFSSRGVLPSVVLLQKPQANNFTFFMAFNTPGELWTLWAIGFVAYFCLLIGYRTKIAQIVSLLFVTSMNGRVLLIENGGYVVQNLLLLWTVFLPMGDRFSLDAMLKSMGAAKERTAEELNDRTLGDDVRLSTPHVTFASLVILLQISALYYFNVVHKTGPAWTNGTAVHYVLYNDRMITPLLANVRDFAPNWLVFFLTRSTLAMEAAVVVLALSPLARPWARRGIVALMCALHIGFGSSFTLGPFAWSCCVFSTLMFNVDDWNLAMRTMRRAERARTVLFESSCGGALWACRILKRFDNLQLLTFEVAEGVNGLAVVRPDGSRATGAIALSEIVAALPLGPIFAPWMRAPGIRNAIDGVLGWLTKRRAASWLGLSPSAKTPREREPSVDAPASAFRRGVVGLFREVIIVAMFVGALNQALVELWVARPLHVPQPEATAVLSHKLRFLQGWFMFSPNPVMDDGTIVVDAVTVDGRHIDPFTDTTPNFDLGHAKSLHLSQIWGDYFNRMHLPGNTQYRDAMKDYMLRLPERTHNANDALVSGDVYWIQDVNPAWNSTESTRFEKVKLFSFNNGKIASK
jgi:hypothetical protein